VNSEERRDLQALEAIAENERITQRRLSTKLGIALGLTNLYLKRLVHKGYVKCVSVQSNRIRYLITPKGIAEKTRLTYEFMDYSLFLYGQVRRHLRQVLERLADGDRKRVAIYGSGEAAELAYMSILEIGLDLVAVCDEKPHGAFLGRPVMGVGDLDPAAFDVMLVATLDKRSPIVESLVARGVPRDKLVALRDDRMPEPETAPADVAGQENIA
jgi:DNA-binding MarR family transcriptional regulator